MIFALQSNVAATATFQPSETHQLQLQNRQRLSSCRGRRITLTRFDFCHLAARLLPTVQAAAGIAGFGVTPIVAAVDKALAENASGRAKLWPSFFATLGEAIRSPIKYVASPQFRWIWLVYGGTYLAANYTDTACAAVGVSPAMPKWLATSFVNTTTCIGKDRAFAKLFGTTTSSSVPMGSYAAWLTRDLVSMGVFFTLPPILAREVAKSTGDEKTAYYVSQFCLPLVLQFVTTPIHLLGYDIFNNPNNTNAQRVAFMKKDYFKNVSIRMVCCSHQKSTLFFRTCFATHHWNLFSRFLKLSTHSGAHGGTVVGRHDWQSRDARLLCRLAIAKVKDHPGGHLKEETGASPPRGRYTAYLSRLFMHFKPFF